MTAEAVSWPELSAKLASISVAIDKIKAERDSLRIERDALKQDLVALIVRIGAGTYHHVNRYRDMLERLEWEGVSWEESACPCCKEIRAMGKHAADCELAKLLGRETP